MDSDFSLLPEISLGKDAEKISHESLKSTLECFLSHGCLRLKNIFNPGYLRLLAGQFSQKDGQQHSSVSSADGLSVGDSRIMRSVVIEGPFNSTELYANPLVAPILQLLLSQNLILGSFGVVAAMPGAEAQHIHSDLENIYTSDLVAGNKKEKSLDLPYAITVIVPITEFNQQSGATKVWPGSHLDAEHLNNQEGVVAELEIGDCLLMDYRLVHGGTMNNLEYTRIALYLVYNRPWFRDYTNFAGQDPLVISQDEFNKIPDEHKRLFSWAFTDSRNYVDRSDGKQRHESVARLYRFIEERKPG